MDRPALLVDDCASLSQEQRRGNTYDAIVMDPLHTQGAARVEAEDQIYPLLLECRPDVEQPLFFMVNPTADSLRYGYM